MTTNSNKRRSKTKSEKIDAKRKGPRYGKDVVWPSGVEERYDISAATRWRWERLKLLPKRDVSIGGKTGWRPETLAQAEVAK